MVLNHQIGVRFPVPLPSFAPCGRASDGKPASDGRKRVNDTRRMSAEAAKPRRWTTTICEHRRPSLSARVARSYGWQAIQGATSAIPRGSRRTMLTRSEINLRADLGEACDQDLLRCEPGCVVRLVVRENRARVQCVVDVQTNHQTSRAHREAF